MSEFEKRFPEPTHETFYNLTIALMLRSVAKNAWHRALKWVEYERPNLKEIEQEIAELEKELQ